MAFPCLPVGSSITKEDWEAALELAARWRDTHSDERYGASGKNLGILARAFSHLKVCYEELDALRRSDDIHSG